MQTPIVLVGNKCDLTRALDEETINKRKSIEMKDIPYIETSAKLDHNIKEVFQELLMLTINLEQNKLALDKQQQAQTKKARNQQHLLRRLSTFGSLPNINLIRRKSNSTNHSSNSSICSNSESSSSSGAEDTPKHLPVKQQKSTSLMQKVPMFYSPIIKRKFNDNHVKQLSLDESKIKNLNQRLINQKIKISNTKSFDTASTTSSFNSNSSSKESLENKCQMM